MKTEQVEVVRYGDQTYHYRPITMDEVDLTYGFGPLDADGRSFAARLSTNPHPRPGDRYMWDTASGYYERIAPPNPVDPIDVARATIALGLKKCAEAVAYIDVARAAADQAVVDAEAALEARNEMIRDGRKAGLSYRDLQALTGLGRARLDQIINERGRE